MKIDRLLYSVLVVFVLSFFVGVTSVVASPTKVGVINLQEILANSKAGQAAAKKIEVKAESYKGKFKSEQDQIKKLEQEIKKKSSAWSEEKRTTKIRELQKAGREYKEKASDASFELKQLQEKELSPILETLREIVQSYGKSNGYAVILEKTPGPGIVYFDKSVDISDDIIKELDEKMSGK